MLRQADCGGGWEGMKGVRYSCKWVLTVSNSGGELGVKVLGRVTWGWGPAQGNGWEGGDHRFLPFDQSLQRTNSGPTQFPVPPTSVFPRQRTRDPTLEISSTAC